jgi:hypothetical protein
MKKIIVMLMVVMISCFATIGCETDDSSDPVKMSDIEKLQSEIQLVLLTYQIKPYYLLNDFEKGELSAFTKIINRIDKMKKRNID